MSISAKIIEWYELNKRPLPWRDTKDPYHIWLSEIILQQTRVDQGMAYYQKFVDHYPTVFDLANATEEEVLKDWQGLGYYSRARNLHYTANVIASKYNGIFPNTHQEILQLKGIGAYTAAAISSFCFNLPHAVIDGNVYRVLARLFGIETPIDTTSGKVEFEKLASNLLDKKNPGNYNQAIMEFGALHCKPQNPDCSTCIFQDSCKALEGNKVNTLPIKSKKIGQRKRYFNYLVIRSKGRLFLKKRTSNDIWKNMYDFPLIENEKKLSKNNIIASDEWKNIFESSDVVIQNVSASVIHLLSHQKINAVFWEITSKNYKPIDSEKLIEVKESDIHRYPVPKLIENYLDL